MLRLIWLLHLGRVDDVDCAGDADEKKHVLATREMWSRIDRFASIHTPRLRTTSDGSMTVLLTVIVLHCCGSWRSCEAVPNHNSSVLPALSCRRLTSHQSQMSFAQLESRVVTVAASCGRLLLWPCMSSVKRWRWTLCRRKMSATSSAYCENTLGPRTEPCGRPNSNMVSSDAVPPKCTVWWRSLRNASNQPRALPVMPKRL